MAINSEIETWKNFDKAFSIEDSHIFKTKSFKIDYMQEEGLRGSQLKKLRNEWIKILPHLDNVEFAFFGHKVNQRFFEAICSMPSLRGLWIKWSQLDDFSIIHNLKSLNYLVIGGSVKIPTLNGLENLSDLKSLELSSFFGIKSLSELTGLTKLERLKLYGSLDGKRLQIEDIKAVSNLKNLDTLILDIKSKGIDITPIFGLRKLQTLILPNSYFEDMRIEDILKLYPNLKRGVIDN